MLIIIGAICHLRYIASGIGISLCQQGSPLGPILFLLIFNIPHIIIRYFLTMIGYKSGTSLVEGARGGAILQKLSKGATIVGLMAIQATNSATATVLQSLQLLPVAVVACVIGRRAPKRREIAGMVLALAGTFLITTGGDPSQMALPPAGLLFGLLAALGGAGLAVFPGRILAKYGVTAVNGWAMLMVGLVTAPFVPDWGQAAATFDGSCWMVFATLVVLGTWCSYLFYMRGVHEIGSLKTAMLSTVEPISATVLSALWIGVVFSPTDLLGFALIIIMMPLVA